MIDGSDSVSDAFGVPPQNRPRKLVHCAAEYSSYRP
jgi:hypothetical protein